MSRQLKCNKLAHSQTKHIKAPLISRWLLVSLLVALLHIAFDHEQIDIHDSSSSCDVCRLVQIDATSPSQISIVLDKYTRTDFSSEVPYSTLAYHSGFFARAPPSHT
ncbi:MAG: hypothetical protein OEX07_12050 [Gammaproteobacteria bacterium]|nr:hypothetical protein [Gammaproteobacteria bacterium]